MSQVKTVLVPGVGWPSVAKIARVNVERGNRKAPMSKEEVMMIRRMRKDGDTLTDLQQIFRRGKGAINAALFGHGRYAGY